MDGQLEDSLRKAIDMEIQGKSFYLEAAEKSRTELAKMVFRQLAEEEDIHINVIETIYSRIKEESKIEEWITGTRENKSEILNPFRKELLKEAIKAEEDIDALKFGMEMEEKSIKYYEELKDTTDNPYVKRFFLTLAFEERGHYLKLFDAVEFLTNPESFLLLKERSMRDGG
ncbi:MAG: ferritin family protein [Deltaproteobacteria bacterium]|nr:ferritin family protein [Deltaproteobacteria bacterium]